MNRCRRRCCVVVAVDGHHQEKQNEKKNELNYEIDIENSGILKMAGMNELTMRMPYAHRRIHTRLIHIKRKMLSSDITLAYTT